MSYDEQMRTFTLRLPEELMASIDAEAQKGRTTRSEIVRRRLTRAAPPVTETWPAALEILEGAWAGAGPAVRLSYGNPHKQRILDAIRRKKP